MLCAIAMASCSSSPVGALGGEASGGAAGEIGRMSLEVGFLAYSSSEEAPEDADLSDCRSGISTVP